MEEANENISKEELQHLALLVYANVLKIVSSHQL